MSAERTDADTTLPQPFTIHVVNSYLRVELESLARTLDLKPSHLQKWLRACHLQVERDLRAVGIEYASLGAALTPRRDRHEVAFVFNSRAVGNSYGIELASAWIPALRKCGPKKTAISVGDILRLPAPVVWQALEARLVGVSAFPRLSPELYFVVYMTNFSRPQLERMHVELVGSSPAYLGYVDCSTWSVLKAGLFLPQVALRADNVIITDTDDADTPNQPGYPYAEFGLKVIGIREELYGNLLTHRIDNGVPAWAEDDSAMALTLLGGQRESVADGRVTIDDSRVDYLRRKHAEALQRAGLADLDSKRIASAIHERASAGLVFNLRFIEGVRAGQPASELDALMYSVQVEFPDGGGEARRFQVGLKYHPTTHASEVVTFF